MTAEQKEKHIKLLKKNNSSCANAILFYLTNTKEEFEKKKQFVEKVLDKYGKIMSVSNGELEEHLILVEIPTEIREKLYYSYCDDFDKIKDFDEEDLIAEMNTIF